MALLLKSRRLRRRQELQELGGVLAFAYHDHKNMGKLFVPSIEETLDTARNDPHAWENDKWWDS